jgi:hypothetical protein
MEWRTGLSFQPLSKVDVFETDRQAVKRSAKCARCRLRIACNRIGTGAGLVEAPPGVDSGLDHSDPAQK